MIGWRQGVRDDSSLGHPGDTMTLDSEVWKGICLRLEDAWAMMSLSYGPREYLLGN